jgi:hypothetical protein
MKLVARLMRALPMQTATNSSAHADVMRTEVQADLTYRCLKRLFGTFVPGYEVLIQFLAYFALVARTMRPPRIKESGAPVRMWCGIIGIADEKNDLVAASAYTVVLTALNHEGSSEATGNAQVLSIISLGGPGSHPCVRGGSGVCKARSSENATV